MRFKLKPDFEKSKSRFDAFWHCELIDRPPVSITIPVSNPAPIPQKKYACNYEKWLDIDFRVERIAAEIANREYLGDALPIAWPNLGPEIFSAWCGCGYKFGEDTAWSEQCIFNWETDAGKAVFNPENFLFKEMVRFTKALLDRGRGSFIVGLTDFHIGGDHIAALRNPQNLAVDLIENPAYVVSKMESSYQEYFSVYEYFYNMLRAENMPVTTWTPLMYDGRFYIPSCDFSCMISRKMFDEVFLPGIEQECRFYDRTIYHLDGPDALRHIDSLLAIRELDGIQWVCGAGREGYAKWVGVYRRIQEAGKAIQLFDITLDELPMVFETLKPEGIWFSEIKGIEDRSTAEYALKRINEWK